MNIVHNKTISLPHWISTFKFNKVYLTDHDKMQLAIELSLLNIEHETGGPFGAAVFNEKTGALVSVGVNCVVTEICSISHAEIMALVLAQTRLKKYRLDLEDNAGYVLVTSSQPCSMCFGACLWSGVKRIIIGARRTDVEKITRFDEGPLPSNWKKELDNRGILLDQDMLRKEACEVLMRYKQINGLVY